MQYRQQLQTNQYFKACIDYLNFSLVMKYDLQLIQQEFNNLPVDPYDIS